MNKKPLACFFHHRQFQNPEALGQFHLVSLVKRQVSKFSDILMIRPLQIFWDKYLGWLGLGWTTGTRSSTWPRNFSLAPNHPFTHMTSHQEELFQRKESLHSHVCTGKFTQTGSALTVFLYHGCPGMKHPWLQYSSFTVFTLIHKNLGKVPKKVPKKRKVLKKNLKKKWKVPVKRT